MDNEQIMQHFMPPAKTKWLYLQDKGYKLIHLRSTGVVFGTAEGGAAGHISWYGKVIWLDRDGLSG